MLIFWDTEYTCWEGSQTYHMTEPGQDQEVFQIAAVKLNPEANWEEVETLNVLAKPVKNPVLSPYAEKLTGISQADLEAHGLDFPTAVQDFAAFCEDIPMYSCGGDERAIANTCRIHNIRLPFPSHQCFDARLLFERAGLNTHGHTSGSMYQAVGLNMDGHIHNALHDCRSLAAVAKYLTEQGNLNLS